MTLDSALAKAVSKRDFAQAAKLQAEIEDVTRIINEKRDLEQAIREAVVARDWSAAAEIQKKIDALDQGEFLWSLIKALWGNLAI